MSLTERYICVILIFLKRSAPHEHVHEEVDMHVKTDP